MMLTGKTIKAVKAKKLGLVDKVVESLGKSLIRNKKTDLELLLIVFLFLMFLMFNMIFLVYDYRSWCYHSQREFFATFGKSCCADCKVSSLKISRK